MRRFLGVVLIGLGALFLAAAVGLPLYVAPALAKLPYDLKPCPAPKETQPSGCLKPSVAEAEGATFLQKSATGAKINTATLRSTTEVIPRAAATADEQKAGRLGDNGFIWDVYQTNQRTDDNKVISASSTELALDRSTAEALNWSGQWIEDGTTRDTSIKYSGLTYKFGFGTKKQDYKIYDTEVRAASTAKFQSVDTVDGIEVYHFVQTIPETKLAVDAADIALLKGLFAPEATDGKVVYTNTREVWVDPVTGAFINVREQQTKTFVPDVGSQVTLLDADFKYTKETIANSADSAKSNGSQLRLITVIAPIVFGILALIFLVGGFLLARRGRGGSTAEPQAWDDSLPKPRRHLREERAASAAGSTAQQPRWSDPDGG